MSKTKLWGVKEMMKHFRGKPWLRSNGEPFTREELEKQSTEWRPHQWEQYLQNCEPLLRHDDEIYLADFTEVVLEPSTKQSFSEIYETVDKEALSSLISKGVADLLRPSQKRILKLKYWKGMTHREIAKLTDCSHTAVRRSLDSATATLKKHLQTSVSGLSKKEDTPHL